MQILKKMCVWVVTLCMLLTTTNLSVWAADAVVTDSGVDNISGVLDEESNITRTLLDFNNQSTITSGTAEQGAAFAVSTGVYEAPNTASAQWTQSGASGVYRFDLYPNGKRVLDSVWFNLRLYSPEANGAVYQFVAFNGKSSKLDDNIVAVSNITANWVGWKTISVELTYQVGVGFSGLAFAYGAWSDKYSTPVTNGASLYLSKVWMSVTLPDLTVITFDNDESLNAYRAISTSKFTKSTLIKEEPNTMSAKWQQNANGEFIEYNFATSQNWAGGTKDANSYKYVNLRLYSPEESGATFQFMKISNGPAFNGRYNNCYAGIIADWTGWKTISIPISCFEGSNTLWGNVSGMAFAVGWNNKPGFVKGATIYLDRIWLSVNEEPENLKGALTVSDKTLLTFDNESTITEMRNLQGKGFYVSKGSEHGICEAPNTMAARWTVDVAGAHSEKVLTQQPEDWSVYGFLNIRAYSHEASDAIFQVTLFEGGSHYSWAGGKGVYGYANIKADWSGWKTVSIPLTSFQGNLNISKVSGIAFTNGGWSTPYTMGATIYMDRIWLSGTAPEANLVPATEESISLNDSLFIEQPVKSVDGNSLLVQTRLLVNGDTVLDTGKVSYCVAQFEGNEIKRLKASRMYTADLTEGVENSSTLDISSFEFEEGDTLKCFVFIPDSIQPLIKAEEIQ